MKKPRQLPFFVYGTLLPEQPNFFLWGSAITSLQSATLSSGQLYDMGFYPMLVATQEEAKVVRGRLITVNAAAYEAVQQRLDELEGYDPNQPNASAYRRQIVDVVLANGRSQKAWGYLGQSQFVQGKPVVTGGDWVTYAVTKQLDLQDWWHTVGSVAGLHGK